MALARNLSRFGELLIDSETSPRPIQIGSFGYLLETGDIVEELQQFIPQIKYKDDAYYLMLTNLLPRGYIWTGVLDIMDQIIHSIVLGETTPPPAPSVISPDTDTNYFKRFLSCFASELARLEVQTMELVKEPVPGLATDCPLYTSDAADDMQ